MISAEKMQGGDMPDDLMDKIKKVVREFGNIAYNKSREWGLPPAAVRSNLTCNLVLILDSENLFIVAQKQHGMQRVTYDHCPDNTFDSDHAIQIGIWWYGLEDPFVVKLPSHILDKDTSDRYPIIEGIAKEYVELEYGRMKMMTNIIQIKPLFGPPAYTVNPDFVFVLMPFTPGLTKIYDNIVKPLVEGPAIKKVCRRADDFTSVRQLIQDIWKAICEARIVIADLTSLNANVMYELGIAHTLGKETILIYQKRREKNEIPFDVAHIRRIEYEDSAAGGKQLERDLLETITSILKRQSM